MNRLLILSAEATVYQTLVESAGLPQLKISTAVDTEFAGPLLADCNIILGDPPLVSEVLEQAPVLQWVQSSWAGVDSLCKKGQRRDYVLTGARDVFGPLMSEYMMAYLLMFERQLLTMLDNQHKKHWQPLSYRPPSEITLGLAGLGSIGKHLANTARSFGIRVIGLNRTGTACEHVEAVYTHDENKAFFEQSDYIILTLPGTSETRHFINAEKLGLMKSSAILMNVGRGGLINEDDLIYALGEGVIAGAVLDVFEQEPLSKDSPLWTLPNVYVTPHNAATSFPADIAAIFIENYQRFTQAKALRHVIDFEAGY